MEQASDLFSLPVGLAGGAILAGFVLVSVAKVYGLFFMRWKSPFRVGEEMNARQAKVVEWANGAGYVRADGELWRATSTDELKAGDAVTVAAVDGLLLKVNRKT